MKVLLNLLFICVFFIQTTQAYSATPNQMKRIVTDYNSLSVSERVSLVKQVSSSYSDEEKAIIDEVNKDLRTISWPKLQEDSGKIIFKIEDREITISNVQASAIEINGEIYDFSPGKLKDAYTKLQRNFNPKSSVFLRLFMDEAHADPATLILSGILLVLSLIMAGLIIKEEIPDLSYLKEQDRLCKTMNKKFKQIESLPIDKACLGQLEKLDKELDSALKSKAFTCLQDLSNSVKKKLSSQCAPATGTEEITQMNLDVTEILKNRKKVKIGSCYVNLFERGFKNVYAENKEAALKKTNSEVCDVLFKDARQKCSPQCEDRWVYEDENPLKK